MGLAELPILTVNELYELPILTVNEFYKDQDFTDTIMAYHTGVTVVTAYRWREKGAPPRLSHQAKIRGLIEGICHLQIGPDMLILGNPVT